MGETGYFLLQSTIGFENVEHTKTRGVCADVIESRHDDRE
jgi:hypothetical protein